LFSAVALWLSKNGHTGDSSDLWARIRFGLIPPAFLIKTVEASGLVPTAFLLKAFRYHCNKELVEKQIEDEMKAARKGDAAAPSVASAAPDLFFRERAARSRQREEELARHVQDVSLLQAKQESLTLSEDDEGKSTSTKSSSKLQSSLSAKGQVWELSMSSKYESIDNTYATLINNQYEYPGAATGSEFLDGEGGEEWIQAKFKAAVLVREVILSAPVSGGFEDYGFGQEHLTSAKLQYSTDGHAWKTVIECSELSSQSGNKYVVKLPKPVAAKFWRLSSDNGDVDGVATGTFIFQ